jgi:hypothetical protein
VLQPVAQQDEVPLSAADVVYPVQGQVAVPENDRVDPLGEPCEGEGLHLRGQPVLRFREDALLASELRGASFQSIASGSRFCRA